MPTWPAGASQLDLGEAGGREGDLARRSAQDDLAAVGLVADRDDRLAPARDGLAQAVERRAGREPLVDDRLEARRRRDRLGRLARAAQRARDDRVGLALGEQLAEHAARVSARASSAGAVRRASRAPPSAWRTRITCTRKPRAPRGSARIESRRDAQRFRYVVVDVFTDTPLAGNQLAVFTDARDLDPLTMQALAREMNFAESVFVLPPTVARRRRPDPDLHAVERAPLRRPPGARRGRSSSARRCRAS